MSADTVLVPPRRRVWQSMSAHQQRESGRLTLVALAAALSGSASGVARAFAEAGAVGSVVEAHVLWATGRLAGDLRLTVDPDAVASRYLTEGKRLHAHAQQAGFEQLGML